MLIKKAIAFLFLCLLSLTIAAKSSLVDGVRIWSAPDHSRLVFDVDGPITYNTFRLDNPERLVIDFKNAKLRGKLAKPSNDDLFMKNLRFAKRNKSDFRVVLDLKNKSRLTDRPLTLINQNSYPQIFLAVDQRIMKIIFLFHFPCFR